MNTMWFTVGGRVDDSLQRRAEVAYISRAGARALRLTGRRLLVAG